MKATRAKTLACVIAVSAAVTAGAQTAVADDNPPSPRAAAPASPPEIGERVQQITGAVLDHHLDPPTRQEMLLSGIRALYQAAGRPAPLGLSRRISAITTPEQVQALLKEIWPRPVGKGAASKQLEQVLLEGLLADVAGGTQLVSAKERKVAESMQGNRYVGIQIALGMDQAEKRAAIQEIFEGGPAHRAGARTGDLIEKVDKTDTAGLTLVQVVDLLRGDEGTSVTVKVRQPQERTVRTLTMVRGQLPRSTVQGVRKRSTGGWDVQLDGSTPIGYLHITNLAASTPHELRKLAAQLESQGNWGLVLDLRRLGGTSLHSAVLLADSLLAGGVIGRVQTAEREMTYKADSDALFRTAVMAVLVDGTTSGTAEWLAAALQDNHRAIIVGTPTFSAAPGPMPNRIITRVDPRSMVTVGDGSWSIEMATGRLERGDGRPLTAGKSIIGVADRLVLRSSEDSANVKTGVTPDHVVVGSGPNPRRPVPPAREGQRAAEPSTASDPVLREAVRLLQLSLQKYI